MVNARRHVMKFLAVLAVASLVALGCATARPSDKPLGWGPLTPEMKADQTAPRKRGGSVTDQQKKKPEEIAERVEAKAETKAADAPHGDGTKKDANAAPSPTAAGIAATAFVGDFAGEDTAVYTINGLPDRTEKDPNAKITVKSPREHQVAFVLVDSSNGNEICTLNATTAEAAATILPGQKCFEQSDADVSTAATVTKGVATLKDAHLVVNVSLDFVLRTGDRDLSGGLEYHFDGNRH